MRNRPVFQPSSRSALARCASALSLLALLAACGTATPPRFHSLMPVEVGPRAPASPASGANGLAVVLEPIRLPAQVDQPQWLVQLPDHSAAVLEQERWASALRDEFRQALLEELIVGHGIVDARTQPAQGAAPWRVTVDVRRFESLPGRESRIEGSWTIASGESRRASSRCEWLIRERAGEPLLALAAAHRRAVARLGDAIGKTLARERRGESPGCPALDDPR